MISRTPSKTRFLNTSPRSTQTSEWRRSSYSTPTTSTPQSQNSTRDTSRERRTTRTHMVGASQGPHDGVQPPARSPSPAADYAIVDPPTTRTMRGEPADNIRACLAELTPDLNMYVESVHRLSERAAVVTHAAHGTSQDGLRRPTGGCRRLDDRRRRGKRCELFDETDLDAALARFDELHTACGSWRTRRVACTSAATGISRSGTGPRWPS